MLIKKNIILKNKKYIILLINFNLMMIVFFKINNLIYIKN